MKNLTDYLSQERIDELAAKGITFERYIKKTYQYDWGATPVTETLIKEETMPDVWLVKKPKVKSRKALHEQGIAEIESADGWFYDSPDAKYILNNDGGFRVRHKDFLNYYYASTIGELIDDYNRDIVFDPNEKC